MRLPPCAWRRRKAGRQYMGIKIVSAGVDANAFALSSISRCSSAAVRFRGLKRVFSSSADDLGSPIAECISTTTDGRRMPEDEQNQHQAPQAAPPSVKRLTLAQSRSCHARRRLMRAWFWLHRRGLLLPAGHAQMMQTGLSAVRWCSPWRNPGVPECRHVAAG